MINACIFSSSDYRANEWKKEIMQIQEQTKRRWLEDICLKGWYWRRLRNYIMSLCVDSLELDTATSLCHWMYKGNGTTINSYIMYLMWNVSIG